jgi:hypothetical protein
MQETVLSEGSVVSVPVKDYAKIIQHKGILAWNGFQQQWTVISNSKRRGRVVEESLPEFSEGETVTVEGYPSSRPSHEVVRIARSEIGREWKLSDNCEHFVRYVHGLRPESPQRQFLTGVGLFALFVGGMWLVTRR